MSLTNLQRGKVLMLQGTHSSAGKSLLVTALCRIFAQDGWKVAPFKAQNMSLNAGVTSEGGEIGRAQIVQAEAAGISPHTDMNPILLKPEGNRRSQVVLNGRVYTGMEAGNFYKLKDELWPHVTGALERLRSKYDIVVLEGAGSPAEINLKMGDIVNMRIALHAQAPVLLVGDIDRGGVFAALVGTMILLEPEERERVKGFLINKFRGDIALLGDGLRMLQERAFNVPTLGVIPYLPNHGIAEEDSTQLDDLRISTPPGSSALKDDFAEAVVDIAIVRLPSLSNFDEFDALRHEPGVRVRFIQQPAELAGAQAVILPGSKMTIPDLMWLRQSGLADKIVQCENIVGICGGYQMLSHTLYDPQGVESAPGTRVEGLALLPTETVFEAEKITEQTSARVLSAQGAFASLRGSRLQGYQIHTGRTHLLRDAKFARESEVLLQFGSDGLDGFIRTGGRIWGCYLHGIFENDALRHAWLRSLGWQGSGLSFEREAAYNRLADHVRAHVDLARIYEMMQ